MTDEQKKMVEDNHNLIYFFLKKYDLPIDEWYDMAAIGLCKAARSYNEELSKFATYACKCMFTTVFCEKRKERSSKAIPACKLLYYQAEIRNRKDDDCGNFIDYMPSDENVEESVLFQITYNGVLEKLKEREKNILQMMSDGYSQQEIGRKLNLSQSYISRIAKQVKNYLKRECIV